MMSAAVLTPPVRPAHRLRTVAGFAVVVGGIVASVAGLQRVPAFSVVPALLGLSAFVIGKYVFCPLRWKALSGAEQSSRWFVQTFAAAELLGLCTPGHAGADLWRVRRLEQVGRRRGCAIGEVAADRLVGSMGVLAFALLSGGTLPRPMLAGAAAALVLLGLGAHLVLRMSPRLRACLPALPTPGRLTAAFAYSLGYQAAVLTMLMGVVGAVGATVNPLALAGVFAASQCAGIVPGPQGASPKDGALAVGLVALGVPWEAALGAVSLKAALAWLPGIVFGGVAFLLSRLEASRGLVGSVTRPATAAVAHLVHPAFAHAEHNLASFPVAGVEPAGALGAAAA